MKKADSQHGKVKLRRGFKAESERMSASLREEMGLKTHDPLNAFDLAKHLKIPIYEPHDFGLSKKELSLLLGPSGWSAFTLVNRNKKKVIVHNNQQSDHRQQANIMHELSHILCKHENASSSGLYDNYRLPSYMREYNYVQEEEAKFLGGCLQLPRECLLWAIGRQGMSKKQISDHYMASGQMVTFRINTTGIKYQLKYATIR